jgi:hypothetical protein
MSQDEEKEKYHPQLVTTDAYFELLEKLRKPERQTGMLKLATALERDFPQKEQEEDAEAFEDPLRAIIAASGLPEEERHEKTMRALASIIRENAINNLLADPDPDAILDCMEALVEDLPIEEQEEARQRIAILRQEKALQNGEGTD